MKHKTKHTLIRRRDAQVQSMQTIIIAVFMTLIIGIALLIYFKAAKRSAENKVEEVSVLRGLEIVNKMQKLPEFSCPSGRAAITPCIDLSKAKAFSNLITNDNGAKAFYSDLLGNIKANITNIYPGNTDSEMVFDMIGEEGNQNKNKSVMAYQIPINIYDPLSNPSRRALSFGVIYIEEVS